MFLGSTKGVPLGVAPFVTMVSRVPDWHSSGRASYGPQRLQRDRPDSKDSGVRVGGADGTFGYGTARACSRIHGFRSNRRIRVHRVHRFHGVHRPTFSSRNHLAFILARFAEQQTTSSPSRPIDF